MFEVSDKVPPFIKRTLKTTQQSINMADYMLRTCRSVSKDCFKFTEPVLLDLLNAHYRLQASTRTSNGELVLNNLNYTYSNAICKIFKVSHCNNVEDNLGTVHKIRHAILANFDPLPPSLTLCHTSRDPPKVRHTSLTPRFLVGLVQKSRTNARCINSLSIVRGGFCPRVFCLKGFVRVGFVRYPFCQSTSVTTES